MLRLPGFAHEAPLRVDDETLDALSAEREAVERRMRRSRDLNGDIALQPDGIVSRNGLFGGAVMNQPLFQHLIHRLPLVPERDQPYVAEARAAGAAQVRLRKAADPAVLVLVSGAVLEVADSGIGSRLHKSHRIRGGRGGVPVSARPDERIDPVDGRGGNGGQNTGGHHQQKPTFHP